MKVRTHYNYSPDVDCAQESSDKPSLAVPDQSLSVRQILDRFRRGTLSEADISRPGFYDPDSENDFNEDVPMNDYSDLTDFDSVGSDLANAYSRVAAEKRLHQVETPPPDSSEDNSV